MVVGPDGTAYLGNFGFDLMGGAAPATAALLRISASGDVSVAAEGLHFPNGSVITPDGRTLIVDESFGNRTSAFEITADGLGPRRDWAVFGPVPQHASERNYVPDGCGLDAEGCLWIADAGHGRVCRVREGGEILETVEPGTGVFACMLGGEDGRDLIMCCAPDFFEDKRSAAKEAELKVTRVEVPRAGWP
jgi:sugar lactone lactonase YvrE